MHIKDIHFEAHAIFMHVPQVKIFLIVGNAVIFHVKN